MKPLWPWYLSRNNVGSNDSPVGTGPPLPTTPYQSWGDYDYYPAFPQAAQLVMTAWREAAGELHYHIDDYETTEEALVAARAMAISNLGAWTPCDPYDSGNNETSYAWQTGMEYPGDGQRILHTRAREIKWVARLAPMCSSRGKIMIQEWIGQTPDYHYWDYKGSQGITLDGISRVLPAWPNSPTAQDAAWLYDPAGPRRLPARSDGVVSSANLYYATNKRGEDFIVPDPVEIQKSGKSSKITKAGKKGKTGGLSLKTGGLKIGGLKIGGLKMTGLKTSGLKMTGLKIGGLKMTGLKASGGLKMTGFKDTGLKASGGLKISGFKVTGVKASGGMKISTIESSRLKSIAGLKASGGLRMTGGLKPHRH